MGFLDKILPFFVGKRSEILGAAYFIIRALAIFGVVPSHIADNAGELIRPAFGATLAAKINRIGAVLVESAKSPS